MVTVSPMEEGVAQQEGSVRKVQISDRLAGQRTRKVSVAGKTVYIILRAQCK